MLYQKGNQNMLYGHLILGIMVALFGSFAMGAEPDSLWIKKPVAEALEQAKRENKPALLYWGAIWCPPCNQLKAQVFSHPEFATATSSFIRIYLDGDDAGAQNWSEKLDVSGYPTVLVLAPEKHGRVTTMKERLRIAEFVNFTEFRSLLSTALASSLPMKKDLVSKALRRKATSEEWKLLAFTWDIAETNANTDEAQTKSAVTELKKLFSACPYPEVRGLLAARLLNLDTGIHSEWLEAVIANDASLYAARGPLLTGAAQWLEKAPSETARDTAEKLRVAIKKLRSNSSIGPAEQLQTWVTSLDVEQYMADHKWIDSSQLEKTRNEAVSAAMRIESSSKSPYERHAVVSDAAAIFATAGKINLAMDLLKREASTSDTPWYYQSTLGSLALQKKEYKEALNWSAKARDSAQGQATRLQWLASDILMQSKIIREQAKNGSPKIISEDVPAAEIATWLDLAKSLPDGFSGRNALRAHKIKEAVTAWPETAVKRETLTKWAETCIMLKNEAGKSCAKILQQD